MLSCTQVAAHFRRSAAGLQSELAGVVTEVVSVGTARAKSYVGHQQESWPDLSDATIYGFRHELGFWITGKADLGFSPPDYEPLLRTGQMRDSIRGEQQDLTGAICSDDKVMLYQEMGTPNARYPIPPRPTLALALMETVPLAVDLLADIAETVLIPSD